MSLLAKRKNQYSTNLVTRRLRLLVFVFVPLFIVNMVVSFYISSNLKEQTTQYIVNTMELYSREIDNTIARINRRMGQLLVSGNEESETVDGIIEVLRSSENEVERVNGRRQLQDIFATFSQEYGDDYNFFMYLDDRQEYVRGSLNTLPQRVYKAYGNAIMEMIRADKVELNSGVQFWKSFTLDEMGSCIMKLYRKDDVFIGCWIRAEDLISPLENMDFGKGGFAVLTDANDVYLTGQEKVEEYGLRMQRIEANRYRVKSGFWSNHLVVERAFHNAPFLVKLLIAEYGMFDKILIFQTVLLLLALAMFTALLVSSYIMTKQILGPVRKFSENLARMQAGGGGEYQSISGSELYELEQANDEFRRLMRQIQGLEIEIYRQQLEKQNVELNYLKLQIKPHFYLNCLNFIHNMIDMEDTASAMKMAKVTSGYLRFLFRDGMDQVTVEEELSHVDNYLAILQMRYNTALEYFIDQDEETRGATVPPMIIQTFVENSIKHSMSLDSKASISVTVTAGTQDEEERLVIMVADNGRGFPPEVLEALEQNGKVSSGSAGSGPEGGVGIENSLKRIAYHYGAAGRVRFYNSPAGGAIVEIDLPAQPPAAPPQKGGAAT